MTETMKFEIPLTTKYTEDIFEIIDKYDEHISYVFAPPYKDYAGSGRPFLYNMNEKEYHNILSKVNNLKEVIITDPAGVALKRYVDFGIRNFMVSTWSEELDNIKRAHPDLKITRSIVQNAHNEIVDNRFDGIVAPYKALLSPKLMDSIRTQIDDITIIPNHYCRYKCPSLDSHTMQTVDKTSAPRTYDCPDGIKNMFIPREILLRLLPNIKTIKLVDRVAPPIYYVNYMKYYLGMSELENLYGVNEINNRTIQSFESSNLATGDCEFKCITCTKKCY